MRRLLSGFVLAILSLSMAAARDEAGTWQMTSAQPVQDVVGEDYNPSVWPYLAPDGSVLAWSPDGDSISVYSFDEAVAATYPAPENCCGLGRYSNPSWSPDSRYFTFTESVFDRLLESDIWMLDRESGEIVDRTDDGLFGGWMKIEEPFDVDYVPTWNPANSDLYFFRTPGQVGGGRTTSLYLMPVGRTEPKLITDLTANLPVLSVYRPVVISPDGRHMALIALGNDLKDPLNGVWTIDLKTAELEQIATVEDLRTGLPAWQEESGLFPEFLQWAGNDALVVLSRDLQFATAVTAMAYYIDLGTQEVTPLAQFEDVAAASDLFREEPQSPIYRIPRSGVVAPDGSAFFFIRAGVDGRANAGVSMLPLPPDGSEPVDLGTIEDFEIVPSASAPPMMGSNGRAFMFGYLFQFEPA